MKKRVPLLKKRLRIAGYVLHNNFSAEFNRFYRDFVNKEAINGKSLKEYLQVDGYKLWSYFDLIIKGANFTNYYNFSKFQEIVLEGAQDNYNKLKYMILNPSIIRAFIKFRNQMRWLAKLKKQDNEKADVLFLTCDRFSIGKTAEENGVYGVLIKKLKEKGIRTKLIEYDNFNKLDLLSNIKTWWFGDVDYNFIGQYYDKRTFKEINGLERKIKSKYFSELRQKEEFKDLFKYKGRTFYPQMRKQFDMTFKILPYYVATALISTRRLLEQEKPKVIVVDSEANYYAKSLIQNANRMGIKTIALQFGRIHNEESDISFNNDIFPDVKCVDGTRDKKNLIKYFDYPEDVIKVTGEPRYDVLVENDWSGDQILREIGLDPKKKTILYVDSGPGLGISEGLKSVFKKIKKEEDAQLIIKLHPPTYPSFEFKKMEDKNIKILKKYNTSKLVYASDLVLMLDSTVSIEALLSNKPLIFTHLNRELAERFEFDEEGSAFRAYTKEELRKYILKCLFDKKTQEKLAINRKKSLKKHYYRSPGKSSEAIINIIKGWIK